MVFQSNIANLAENMSWNFGKKRRSWNFGWKCMGSKFAGKRMSWNYGKTNYIPWRWFSGWKHHRLSVSVSQTIQTSMYSSHYVCQYDKTPICFCLMNITLTCQKRNSWDELWIPYRDWKVSTVFTHPAICQHQQPVYIWTYSHLNE